MPKPVCVKCQRFYRPERNGTYWVEGMPIGGAGETPQGTEAPHLWRPYKVWLGDLWKCKGCGHEIIVGNGASPVKVQHEPDFKGLIKRLDCFKVMTRVNDC